MLGQFHCHYKLVFYIKTAFVLKQKQKQKNSIGYFKTGFLTSVCFYAGKKKLRTLFIILYKAKTRQEN